MIVERLFGKCRRKNIKRNKICLWIFYFLFISCTGCAVTPERAKELSALKQLNTVIDWELKQKNKDLQKNEVLVALYLDADEPEDSTKWAEYRCYSISGCGYSGIQRVPFGTPWLVWERVRSGDFKKSIVIDPGPPYKNVTKIVNLIPGEVTNLGRIVLEKVEAEGTVSISGIIKDEEGVPMEDVNISSTKGVTTTDSEGYYRIDGLGLEVCDMEVTKNGYIPNNAKVSIRDMENRIIEQNFILSFPRKIRFRYMISPGEIDDFNDPKASGGTASFLVSEKYFPIPDEQINDDAFRKFVERVHLNFRVDDGKLTLDNFYAPIFYKRLSAAHAKKFEDIRHVGPLDYNWQHCPSIQEGDIILINGGEVSDYMVKILFEEIQRVLP